MKKKVLVAMSGGVDSSVAAALLKKQGYSCIGVFMHFWSENDHNSLATTSRLAAGLPPRRRKMRGALMHARGIARSISESNKCCSIEAQEQARKVAQKIGIPFYTLNYKKPFKDIVVDYYISEYQRGRTPNPCVACNQFIKFDLLLKEAQKQGCDFLATGHYARIASEGTPHEARIEREGKPQKAQIKKDQDGRLGLFRSNDSEKDQTYFLYRLDQNKLKKILFPVGKYRKFEVRKIAQKFDLPTANRKDSRGICFVADSNENFLRKYLKVKPGKIVDIDGNEIGEHQGLLYYTVGQRHIKNAKFKMQNSKLFEKDKDIPPLYVIDIDIQKNRLIIGREEDLYKKTLIAEDLNWISGHKPSKSQIGARIRYRHPINMCRIKKLSEGRYQVEFAKPQRAITPGQSVVFYRKDQVLGGGIIK